MIAVFWFVFILTLYAYTGYPVILKIGARLFQIRVKREIFFPKVTFIIAAYNEEKIIKEKIKNTLSLDYPKDQLEIIVVSDCSTDRTDEIVKGYENRGVKLLRMIERGGKVEGHKMAVKSAASEILVFSDATGMYEKDALKYLTRYFSDSRVGCVGGMLRYFNPINSALGSGEGLYWKYEVFLRKAESLLGSLTAVSGSIYAVRKKMYLEFPSELADDLIIPLNCLKNGLHTIYEPRAVCWEETVSHQRQELAKRARIANQNICGLLYMKEMFNPKKYPRTVFILFSHKLLRQLLPVLLILLFGLNLIVSSVSSFYYVLFVAQVLFYGAAFLGFMKEKTAGKNKLLSVPYYFCTTNLGILFGLMNFLRGKHEATWSTIR